MSPLDAARRLDAFRLRQRRMVCLACEQPFAEGEQGHALDCPLLALPRIIAALDLAERVILTMPETSVFLGFGQDRHCRFCHEMVYQGALWAGTRHTPECPWPALVAALKAEVAV